MWLVATATVVTAMVVAVRGPLPDLLRPAAGERARRAGTVSALVPVVVAVAAVVALLRRSSPVPDVWAFTWAFPLGQEEAKREGYGSRIVGSFQLTPDYPGCPHCGSRSFYQCNGCSSLVCWDGESRWVTCPSCGGSGPLEGTITEMRTGGDR